MTKIEWTHRPGTIGVTWNPIRARNRETGGVGHYCIHASEGCRYCYAERLQPRFRNPIRYAPQDRDKIDVFLDQKVLFEPCKWRKPRTAFVCSMTDLFGEWVDEEWIEQIYVIMAAAEDHTFIVLTKRAERMRRFLDWPDLYNWIQQIAWDHFRPYVYTEDAPPRNIWMGVSVENQKAADERIPHLLDTPAVVRFVSAEPLLGPIDLSPYLSKLDWVIVGGESGPNARKMDPDWVRDIRDQCDRANVPFFFKQWGGRNKVKAGRALDGREHMEWPV